MTNNDWTQEEVRIEEAKINRLIKREVAESRVRLLAERLLAAILSCGELEDTRAVDRAWDIAERMDSIAGGRVVALRAHMEGLDLADETLAEIRERP